MKYQSGDKTLKNVGKKLGNITITMVSRICDNALEKTKKLTCQKTLESLDVDEDTRFFYLIEQHREKALKEFIHIFRQVDYDIYDFLMALKKQQFLTNGDLSILKETEIEKLVEIKMLLINNEIEEVKKILLEDINTDNNIITVYQSIISSLVFPNMKRGRPKKVIVTQ